MLRESRLKIERLRKIYHIADIHIRNYKRHEEYRRVFENLYSYLRQNMDGSSLICILGDVVHSKTDVTPELFHEVHSFLKNLSDIGPVLLIPGNHDANLSNSSRMDALTPIVEALEGCNIDYVTDTCHFVIGGVQFTHWSVFDTKDQYHYPEDLKSQYRSVCLFHGPVDMAHTDTGYRFYNTTMGKPMFGNHDLTLLGDIHKFQYIDEDKTIAYPGSLIQQNHGESIEGHGMLVWDLETKSSTHVEIKNDTCFCTVQVKNGETSGELSPNHDNIYLRLVHSNTTQKDLKEIVNQYKQSKNIVETSLLKKKSEEISVDSLQSASKKVSLRTVSEQNKLISSYLLSKKEATADQIDMVRQLNEAVNLSLDKKNESKPINWLPKKFEFSNMFSYGESNTLDFTNMSGTYGIFAKNASGKSTLFDSLIYCVFDKCPKTSKSGQVVNNSADSFKCKLTFEANSRHYCIERLGKKDKNGSVKVDVDFYEIEKGEKVSLNGKDRIETNQIIRTIVGSYEDFVLTSLSSQTDNSNFINLGQKDRKDLLSQFLGVGIFETLHEKVNDSYKEANGAIKEAGSVDFSYEINQTKEDIAFVETEIEQKKSDFSKKDRIKALEKEIDSYKSQLVPIPEEALGSEDKIALEVSKLVDFLDKEKQKIDSYEKEIESIDRSIQQCKEKISIFDQESIKESIVALNNAKKELNKLINNRSILKVKIENNQKKLDNLDKLEYDPNCSFCMNNVFVKDAIKTKESQLELNEQLKELELKIEEATETIDSLKDYEQRQIDLDTSNNELNKHVLSLETTKISFSKSTLQTEVLDKKIGELNQSLLVIKSNKSVKESNDIVKSIVDNLSLELKELRESSEKDQKRLGELEFKKALLSNKIVTLSTSKNRYESMVKKKKIMELYLNCVHRDGIPQLILAEVVPELESETNSIIQQLYDFRVIFQTDDKNINAFIAYSENDFWPVELMSGMERFVVSLAIRIALINISSLPKADFLIIDEGFGVLDSDNLSLMSSMLEYLKSRFKFVVIVSHIDEMKDMVDKTINITKVDNKSKIAF